MVAKKEDNELQQACQIITQHVQQQSAVGTPHLDAHPKVNTMEGIVIDSLRGTPTPTRTGGSRYQSPAFLQNKHRVVDTHEVISAPADALFVATGRAGNRHPFHENMIEHRRLVSEDRWDYKKVAVVVPAYNEKNDVKWTLGSFRDEMICFLKAKQVDELQIYIIIDGSGIDQLETGQITVKSMVEMFQDTEEVSFKLTDGDVGQMESHMEELLGLEKKMAGLRKQQAAEARTAELQQNLYARLKSLAAEKRMIFDEAFKQNDKEFPDYNTRLLKYPFKYQVARKTTRADLARELAVKVTILLKEENRQKRDTLLLAAHVCLFQQKIPFALGFVDCDTNWIKGSLNSMAVFLGNEPNTAAVSGTIILRNECWKNPLTTVQDFNYLVSQISTKEAEHFFGMVTCCPGAFSMMKVEPATDPDYVLPEMTKHAGTVEEKNRMELGEDRFWTTLLLERAFDQTTSKNTKVSYIKNAIAETDAPTDLVTYFLQQRRWINSTNANFTFGLISKLNRFVFSCNPRLLGITYLWLRSILEQVSYFLSPGISGLLLMAMFQDIKLPNTVALLVTITILLMAPFIVLFFPKPRESPLPYRLYCTVLGGGMMVLASFWLTNAIPALVGDMVDTLTDLRKLIVLGFIFTIFLLTFVHGKLMRACTPFYKPLLALAQTPMQYILLPTYCFANIADFSWGNRDTGAASTASELARAQRAVKSFFLFFIVINCCAFSLQFANPDTTRFVFLIFACFVVSSMGCTLFFSIASAVLEWYEWIQHKLFRRSNKIHEDNE
eukprot:GILK01012046.1.p1 GENE.GILK01012046.1~~GILK01012046.1.p1  ORF type:complete len:781 (+),score=147.31 GILK01012046.1:216-2558(+)